MFLGMRTALFPSNKSGLISAVITVPYTAFYFLSVKAVLDRALFTLLMISNTANI